MLSTRKNAKRDTNMCKKCENKVKNTYGNSKNLSQVSYPLSQGGAVPTYP